MALLSAELAAFRADAEAALAETSQGATGPGSGGNSGDVVEHLAGGPAAGAPRHPGVPAVPDFTAIPGADWGHTKVRADRWQAWYPDTEDDPVDEDEDRDEDGWGVPDATAPRAPGRHASRPDRRRSGPVREQWRSRLAFAPVHLSLVALVVALGLGVTAWTVLAGRPRTEPTTVGTAAPLTTGAPTPAGAAPAPAGPAPGAAGGEVVVDVAGKVRRPGVQVLPAGSRVHDAVKAAGGARRGVDLRSLNLARVLSDGEQVVVGGPAPAGRPQPPGQGPADGAGPGLVNLNTADQALLETLPGVGPVTAQAILAFRTSSGGFTSVEQLLDVDGIGEATLATLTPHVTV